MRKHFRYLLIMFVALLLPLFQMSCSRAPELELRQRVAMYSKPAVVRVIANCTGSFYSDKTKKFYLYADGGHGSGFFINPNGYIATRSVPLTESECKERLFKRFAIDLEKDEGNAVNEGLTRDSVRNLEFSQSVILPGQNGNISFEARRASAPLPLGKDISIIKIEVENAPVLKLATSDEIQVQEKAVSIGYPTTADVPDSGNSDEIRGYFNDKSAYEAQITEGAVSNPNKRLAASNTSVLQLDMRSAGYGSAGSPILNAQGEVIGMLASTEIDKIFNLVEDREALEKLIDKQNSFPLAIPVSTIRNFINDSGVENEQAPLDEYYRKGLDLYWQGDYKAAKERFQAVEGAFPQHSETTRLIQETNEKGIGDSVKPEIILWSVLGGIILGLLGLVLYLTQRKPRVVSQSSSPQPERRPRPPITGFPASNGVGQSWIELEGQGQRSELQLTREIHKIGRDPAWSDLEIPTSWEVLSRQHAILKREGSSYRIFDGDGKVPSRNGLMINSYSSVDVHEGYLLKPGDVLIIGKDPKEQVRLSYYSSTANQVVPETKMAK